MDLARAPRRAARKKGSEYENVKGWATKSADTKYMIFQPPPPPPPLYFMTGPSM